VAARTSARAPALTARATRGADVATVVDAGEGAVARVQFARDGGRSIGAAADDENRLVQGDNLAAMRWLARTGFAGRVRCAYLDPPYNSGRTFAEYDDALSDAEWCAMMRPRMEALRELLAEGGALFAEIDDTMLAPLHGLLDDVFGRENRVSTITIVRSAGTGHKAINAGPVNVSDYLLVYAKARARWRPNPLWRERAGYDAAYSLFVPNLKDGHEAWRFESLRVHACAHLGHATVREARAALGKERLLRAIEHFAVMHAGQVVRFAQPRVEAVSREARALIARSKEEPETTFRLPRAGYKEMILRAGNRVLFLADKVRLADSGAPVLVEPLTNVWSDVPFQGIAREGGVVFSRNKKPERLVERVLAMGSDEGDWVIDPFLGSGTTAAVAHKMGRRWLGIERGAQLETMCLPRVGRVVRGEDATGITRARCWAGGGGFGVYV
jgi:adenine-specific DNA-methyltransferase